MRQIPKKSIVIQCDEEFKKLLYASQAAEAIELERGYKEAYEAKKKELDLKKNLKTKDTKILRLIHLELHVYSCLMVFTRFCIINLQNSEDPTHLESWIEEVNNLCYLLRYDPSLPDLEQLVYHRQRVLMLSMKTTLLTLSKKLDPTRQLDAIFHFLGEMQSYRNSALKISQKKGGDLNPYTVEALDLFFNKLCNVEPATNWGNWVIKNVLSTLNYIMSRNEFSEADKQFIEIFMGLFQFRQFNIYFLPKLPDHLKNFHFLSFLVRFLRESGKLLPEAQKSIKASLQNDLLILKKFMLIKLQIEYFVNDTILPDETLFPIQELSDLWRDIRRIFRQNLPGVLLYCYFSGIRDLGCLGMEKLPIKTELFEKYGDHDDLIDVLKHFCLSTDAGSSQELQKKIANFSDKELTKICLYYLAEKSKNKDFLIQKANNILLENSPEVDKDFFAIFENEAKRKEAIKTYLKKIVNSMPDWKNIKFVMNFFHIIKISYARWGGDFQALILEALKKFEVSLEETWLEWSNLLAQSAVNCELKELKFAKTTEEIKFLSDTYENKLVTLRQGFYGIEEEKHVLLLRKLEINALICIQIFSNFCLLQLNKFKDSENWFKLVDETEASMIFEKNLLPEAQLILHRMKVFLLAIKMQARVELGAPAPSIMADFSHFACEMQNYKNSAIVMAYLGVSDAHLQKLITEALSLFSGHENQEYSYWGLFIKMAMQELLQRVNDSNNESFTKFHKDFITYFNSPLSVKDVPREHQNISETPIYIFKTVMTEVAKLLLLKDPKERINPVDLSSYFNYLSFLELHMLGIYCQQKFVNGETNFREFVVFLHQYLQENSHRMRLYNHFIPSSSFRFPLVPSIIDIDQFLEIKSSPDNGEKQNSIIVLHELLKAREDLQAVKVYLEKAKVENIVFNSKTPFSELAKFLLYCEKAIRDGDSELKMLSEFCLKAQASNLVPEMPPDYFPEVQSILISWGSELKKIQNECNFDAIVDLRVVYKNEKEKLEHDISLLVKNQAIKKNIELADTKKLEAVTYHCLMVYCTYSDLKNIKAPKRKSIHLWLLELNNLCLHFGDVEKSSLLEHLCYQKLKVFLLSVKAVSLMLTSEESSSSILESIYHFIFEMQSYLKLSIKMLREENFTFNSNTRESILLFLNSENNDLSLPFWCQSILTALSAIINYVRDRQDVSTKDLVLIERTIQSFKFTEFQTPTTPLLPDDILNFEKRLLAGAEQISLSNSGTIAYAVLKEWQLTQSALLSQAGPVCEFKALEEAKSEEEVLKLAKEFDEKISVQKMEARALSCILAYAQYRLLVLKANLEAKDSDAWFENTEKMASLFQPEAEHSPAEQLLLRKMIVFLLALKAHARTLTGASPAIIVNDFLHFSCEMQNYHNAAEQFERSWKSGQYVSAYLTGFIFDGSKLFKSVFTGKGRNHWCIYTCNAIKATIQYVTEIHKNDNTVFGANYEFIKFLYTNLISSVSFDKKIKMPDAESDFTTEIVNLITKILLGANAEKSPELINGELTLAHLLFIKFKVTGLYCSENDDLKKLKFKKSLLKIQRCLEKFLPWLKLLSYFLPPKLNHFIFMKSAIDIDKIISGDPTTEVKEKKNFEHFLKKHFENSKDVEALKISLKEARAYIRISDPQKDFLVWGPFLLDCFSAQKTKNDDLLKLVYRALKGESAEEAYKELMESSSENPKIMEQTRNNSSSKKKTSKPSTGRAHKTRNKQMRMKPSPLDIFEQQLKVVSSLTSQEEANDIEKCYRNIMLTSKPLQEDQQKSMEKEKNADFLQNQKVEIMIYESLCIFSRFRFLNLANPIDDIHLSEWIVEVDEVYRGWQEKAVVDDSQALLYFRLKVFLLSMKMLALTLSDQIVTPRILDAIFHFLCEMGAYRNVALRLSQKEGKNKNPDCEEVRFLFSNEVKKIPPSSLWGYWVLKNTDAILVYMLGSKEFPKEEQDIIKIAINGFRSTGNKMVIPSEFNQAIKNFPYLSYPKLFLSDIIKSLMSYPKKIESALSIERYTIAKLMFFMLWLEYGVGENVNPLKSGFWDDYHANLYCELRRVFQYILPSVYLREFILKGKDLGSLSFEKPPIFFDIIEDLSDEELLVNIMRRLCLSARISPTSELIKQIDTLVSPQLKKIVLFLLAEQSTDNINYIEKALNASSKDQKVTFNFFLEIYKDSSDLLGIINAYLKSLVSDMPYWRDLAHLLSFFYIIKKGVMTENKELRKHIKKHVARFEKDMDDAWLCLSSLLDQPTSGVGELKRLRLAADSAMVLNVSEDYGKRLCVLEEERKSAKEKNLKKFKDLEYKALSCIKLYSEFRLIKFKAYQKPEEWFKALNELESSFILEKDISSEEKMILQRLKVFLLAIKTLAGMICRHSKSKIISYFMHCVCEMLNSKNLNTLILRNVSIGGNRHDDLMSLILEGFTLFTSYDSDECRSYWSIISLSFIKPVIEYGKKEGLSKDELNFLGKFSVVFFVKDQFSELNNYVNEFAQIGVRVRGEIISALLSSQLEKKSAYETEWFRISRLLFFRLIQLPLCNGKMDQTQRNELLRIHHCIENTLPWLLLSDHFSPSHLGHIVQMQSLLDPHSSLGLSTSAADLAINDPAKFLKQLSDTQLSQKNIKDYLTNINPEKILFEPEPKFSELARLLIILKKAKEMKVQELTVMVKACLQKKAQSDKSKLKEFKDIKSNSKKNNPVNNGNQSKKQTQKSIVLSSIKTNFKNIPLRSIGESLLSKSSLLEQVDKNGMLMSIAKAETLQEIDAVAKNFPSELKKLHEGYFGKEKSKLSLLSELEYYALNCINFYSILASISLINSEFVVIESESCSTKSDLKVLDDLQKLDSKLQPKSATSFEECLLLHKMKVFLQAIKVNLQIQNGASRTLVLADAFLLACKMQNYLNVAEEIVRELSSEAISKYLQSLIVEATNMISDTKKNIFKNAWSTSIMNLVSHAMEYSEKIGNQDYFKEWELFNNIFYNVDFILAIDSNHAANTLNFQIKMRDNICTLLLSPEKRIDENWKKNASIFRKNCWACLKC